MIAEDQIYRGLADIFADVFQRDDIALHAGLAASDVDGWDSFKYIEIIMATEQRFRTKFTSAEMDNLQQLGDLVRIVAARGSL